MNATALRNAITATQLWDTLAGQLLNIKKCEVWSTNARMRKIVKSFLPDMKLAHSVEVLGVHIQTTNSLDFQ